MHDGNYAFCNTILSCTCSNFFFSLMYEESIYNMVSPPALDAPKAPMYRSIHKNPIVSCSTFGTLCTSIQTVKNLSGDDNIPDRAHKYKKDAAWWGGVPGSMHPDPSDFLKKNTYAKPVEPRMCFFFLILFSVSSIKNCHPELLTPTVLKPHIKPQVPKASEKPIMNIVSDKNFITANAVDVILAPARKPAEPAALYTQKPGYGQRPEYLDEVNRDIELEQSYIRKIRVEEENRIRDQIHLLDDVDELIAALKAKWEKVNLAYQKETHITKLDTVGQARRRLELEAELATIEKSIEKLNKRYVFVDNSQ